MQVETLTYAVREGAPLMADFYRADGPGAPLLVAVHGGGWIRGERGQLGHWGRYLASRGFSVLAVDYRKADRTASWPGNLEDVRDAWAYARSHAAELGADPARIGMLGASAGAHLAALAALTTEAAPKVLVLAYGVYDLFAHCRAEVDGEAPQDNPAVKMLGCFPHEDPERAFRASPTLQVTAARAQNLQVMLTWGDADLLVLPDQSLSLATALTKAGAQVSTAPIAGAGHFWFSRDAIDDENGKTQELAPKVAAFLDKAFAS